MKINFTDRISWLEGSLLQKTCYQDVGVNDLAPWRRQLRSWILRTILGSGPNVELHILESVDALSSYRSKLEHLKNIEQISGYYEGPVFSDYPRFYFFGNDFQLAKDENKLHSWGYALPFESRVDAIDKALWETAERQATYYSLTTNKVTYPTITLGDASWLYEKVPRFSSQQTKVSSELLVSATQLKVVEGFWANCLTGGERRFFPISCFYWGRSLLEKSTIVHDITTSGSGGGATKEQAILSGLYELIERDHFLLYWLSGISPTRIDISDEVGEIFNHVSEAKRRYNLEVYFFQLQYDLPVSTVVCLIIDPVLKRVALGGKASPSGLENLRSAYLEALATLSVLRNRDKRIPESFLSSLIKKTEWGTVTVDKSTRVNLYCSDLGLETIRNLWLKPSTATVSAEDFINKSISFRDHRSELRFMAEAFRNLVKDKGDGYHIYIHHFESDLTKFFESYVSRAFVPAFLKLHLNERFVTPISDRLWSFAREKGRKVDSEVDLNPLPHPFP